MIKMVVNRSTNYQTNGLRAQEYIWQCTRRLFRDATQVFVNTAFEAIRNNIDTGMSAASLLGLAARVGLAKNVHGLFKGSKAKYKRYNPPANFERGTGNKSIAQGLAFGKKAYKYDLGSASNQRYKLTFKIVVYQYDIHEEKKLHWESLKKGKLAFIQYWNANKKNSIDKAKLARLIKSGN